MKCPTRLDITQEQDQWVNDLCSHCGSFHPNEFMMHMEQGLSVRGGDPVYFEIDGKKRKLHLSHLNGYQRKRFEQLRNTNDDTSIRGDSGLGSLVSESILSVLNRVTSRDE